MYTYPIETRSITCSNKDSDGDITAIGNGPFHWSPRSKKDAIDDIESGKYRYIVRLPNMPDAEVIVVTTQNGKYLKTNRDSTTRNNLDELDSCPVRYY